MQNMNTKLVNGLDDIEDAARLLNMGDDFCAPWSISNKEREVEA